MKLFMTLLATSVLVSASALASATGIAPLLTFTSNNGSVAPHYRITKECRIYANEVVKVTKGDSVRPVPAVKPVEWTTSVPSSQAAIDLIEEANRGQIERGPAMIGGGVRAYTGFLQGREELTKVTLLLSGGANAVNTSEAARTLVKFIGFNCRQE